jgi:hypothetical protein
LDEWRLVDEELDVGTEVTSVELVGSTDLGGVGGWSTAAMGGESGSELAV